MLLRLSTMDQGTRICLLVFIALMFSITGCDARNSQAERKAKEVREIAVVGMDIDKAIQLLREAGFSVFEKYQPSEAEDDWVAHIRVRETIPLSSTVRETLGVGGGQGSVWVTLQADGTGKIVSIK